MSVLGLYTELFSLRMTHILKNQRAAAETMMLWHGAARHLVKDKITTSPTNPTPWVIPAGGCSVTDATNTCGATLPTPAIADKYLPKGYQYTDTELQFPTAVYATAGGEKYIVTYVPSDATHMGFTSSQFYQQMFRAGLPEISFGVVTVGTCDGGMTGTLLMTKAYVGSTQMCYSVVSTNNAVVVPVGSVGIVSQL